MIMTELGSSALLLVTACLNSANTGDTDAPEIGKALGERPGISGPRVGEHPFFDFDHVSVSTLFGMISYSNEFDADPEPAVGAIFRTPLPYLSAEMFGLEPGDLGLYAEIAATRIERDSPLPVTEEAGSPTIFGIGLEYTPERSESLFLSFQLGAHYTHFGDVDGLDDGFGLNVGLATGVPLGSGWNLFVMPQVLFGQGGDRLYAGFIGFEIPL